MSEGSSKSSKDTLFARINEEVRKDFGRRVRVRELAEKDILQGLVKVWSLLDDENSDALVVIEKLADYYVGLSPVDRDSLLNEGRIEIQSIADSIELLEWGTHSFNRQRWEWCVHVYVRLLEISKRIPQLQRISLYKLGYAFLDLALNLKKEALTESSKFNPKISAKEKRDWDDHFAKADDAISASIYFNEQFLKLGEHPVVRYNLACGWSLLATNNCIKNLGWNSRFIPQLAGFVDIRPENEKAWEEADKFWERFGSEWRQNVANQAAIDEINAFISNGLYELERMFDQPIPDGEPLKPKGGLVAPSEPGELVRLSLIDNDLRFIKYNQKTLKRFTDWKDLHNSMASTSISFSRLWQVVPNQNEIRAIRGIRHEAVDEGPKEPSPIRGRRVRG
jgi:hypothetical protein